MNNHEMGYDSIKRTLLLPVRAFVVGFPLAVVSATFLWVTDYPPDEWPFIAGVLIICLFGAATVLQCSASFVARRLNRYGRRVLQQRGIDRDTHETPAPNRRAIGLLYALAVCLLLTITAWGAAMKLLMLVMARLEMPPLVDGFGTVALVLLGVGLGGLVIAFGIPASVFYLASDDSNRVSRAVTRARGGALSALLGIERGVPFYGGPGLSGVRLRN